MNTPASNSLDSSQVAARLGMCAAALAGVAATCDANAVVVTTFANTTLSIPASNTSIYINFLNGRTGDAASTVAGWDFFPYLSTGFGALTFYWHSLPALSNGAVAVGDVYLDLTPGSTVSSDSHFSNRNAATATVAFQTVGTHVLGFKFWNEDTSAINYGYLTMVNGSTNGFPAAITGWVYENTGAAITTPVPEASTVTMLSMGCLALGAVNLRRLRRKTAGPNA